MSPNTPNDFIGSLVEMAEAYRELPKVQEALSDAQREIAGLANTVARLEAKLMDRSNEITDLNSRIRSLEVERDDAQFHALEADDRTQRALDFIKATFGNAGTLIQALEPPAKSATPDVSVQAMSEAAKAAEPEVKAPGQSDLQMTPEAIDEALERHGYPPAQPAPEVAPMQASPTAPTSAIDTSSSPTVPFPSASERDAATHSTTEPSPSPSSAPPIDRGKYHGLTYSGAKNHFGSAFTWPSRDEWLDNGGTLDNFYA